MRFSLTVILFLITFSFANAQIVKSKKGKTAKATTATEPVKAKPCRSMSANLKSGTVNGLKPTALSADIKKKLPCFTGESTEGVSMNCGGGIYYLNNDIYFYTGRDYIEIRGGFTGSTSPSVLGITRSELTILFGLADKIIDGGRVLIYAKPYGSLRLVFNMEDRCAEIGIHAVPPDKVELCE